MSHRQKDLAETDFRRDIVELPVAQVMKQAQRIAFLWHPKIPRDDVAQRRIISADEQIRHAVVVIVEKPRGERRTQLADSGFLRYIGKGLVVIVMKEIVLAAVIRDIE